MTKPKHKGSNKTHRHKARGQNIRASVKINKAEADQIRSDPSDGTISNKKDFVGKDRAVGNPHMRGKIDVCLDSTITDAPMCPHGPTILFQRFSSKSNGEQSRFYACSCSRGRKGCDFYQRVNSRESEKSAEHRENQYKKFQPPYSHIQYRQRFTEFSKLDVNDRRFCKTCCVLLLKGEEKKHAQHIFIDRVDNKTMRQPTTLLHPLEDTKTNAQYFFSEATATFLTDMLVKQGYKKIVCIGAPSIHELILQRENLESFLLDIDHRYEQFYAPKEFQRYNMFNNHFFNGDRGFQAFRKFILEDTGPIAIVTDPPFGGLVCLIAETLKKIKSLWKETNSIDTGFVPVFWIFPYFMQEKIQEFTEGFSMLDYKVNYLNHVKFSKPNKRGSPVRIFTNVDQSAIELPTEEGYRYCSKCERYVSAENVHCEKCEMCASVNGLTYVHCDACGRCVKPGNTHCTRCNWCHGADYNCQNSASKGCVSCRESGHKQCLCSEKSASSDNERLTTETDPEEISIVTQPSIHKSIVKEPSQQNKTTGSPLKRKPEDSVNNKQNGVNPENGDPSKKQKLGPSKVDLKRNCVGKNVKKKSKKKR